MIKRGTAASIFLACTTLWSANALDTTGQQTTTPPLTSTSASDSASAAQVAPEGASSKDSPKTTTVVATNGGVKITEVKPPPGTKIAIPPTPSFDIIINKHHINSPRVKKLYAQLGVKGSPRILHFVTNRLLAENHHSDNIFFIQPRSFIGILNYLALSVEVTEELLEKRIVQSPRYPDGSFFNFNTITDGILHVYMSDDYPGACANVSVFYRNHWYFIADNDWDSKRTFRAVQQMFNLQAGEISKEGAPVLTIPVSR